MSILREILKRKIKECDDRRDWDQGLLYAAELQKEQKRIRAAIENHPLLGLAQREFNDATHENLAALMELWREAVRIAEEELENGKYMPLDKTKQI